MYVIISFDYGNSNDVSINCITNDLEKASKQYKITLDYNKDYNKDESKCKLIELIEIENDFFDIKGFTLYWGNIHSNAKILLSNNTD